MNDSISILDCGPVFSCLLTPCPDILSIFSFSIILVTRHKVPPISELFMESDSSLLLTKRFLWLMGWWGQHRYKTLFHIPTIKKTLLCSMKVLYVCLSTLVFPFDCVSTSSLLKLLMILSLDTWFRLDEGTLWSTMISFFEWNIGKKKMSDKEYLSHSLFGHIVMIRNVSALSLKCWQH